MSDSIDANPAVISPHSQMMAAARPVMAVRNPARTVIAIAWWIGIILLVLWSAWHLGAADLTAQVRTAAGTVVTVPNMFATVDHPYHVARAQTLLDSLRHGQILRWVGGHEGGYPVEFYPLGVPWLTVGVWALSFGTLSIPAAAKLVVIGIFLSPVLAFAALGRRMGAALPVAGLALLAHLAVPGEWWSGGYTETVEWGLITNVAAYVAAFGFLAALLAFVLRPGRWALLAAIALSVLAVASNTRSVIALVCVVAGVAVSVLIERGWTAAAVRQLIGRLAFVGVPAALLAAPLWVSSLRFGHYYEFIRYEYYADLSAWWTSTVNAVSWPVAMLAVAGLVIAVVAPGRVAQRAAAWTLIAYVLATLVLGGLGENGGLIPQLEATRLMPFQRLLVIYLAASSVVELVRWVARSASRRPLGDALCLIGAVILAVAFVTHPSDSTQLEQRSMFPVPTTASPEYANLLTAVRAADAASPPGTAIFIAGSELSWHQPLWAPLVTDRPLRYDNWLWLWQTWHRSDRLTYDGQAIVPDAISLALQPDYLAQQGIGTVIALTPQMEALADRANDLQRLPGPGYAVYRVVDPVPIISGDGLTVTDPVIDNERIAATVAGPGGTVTVSEAWFPRWRATVDGTSVPVGRDGFGRMTVPVPAGTVSLRLDYGVDGIDTLARVAAVAGLLLSVALVLGSGRRWAITLPAWRVFRPKGAGGTD